MPNIHQELIIDASPARVYAVLMDSADHAEITGVSAKIGEGEGAPFSLFGGRVVGRNVQLIPGSRIVQAWRGSRWEEGVYSIVRIELVAEGDKTRLILDQDGIPEAALALVDVHWKTRYWGGLRHYAPILHVAGSASIPERLRVAYPWPEGAPRVKPYLVSLDGGGRFLIDRLITKTKNRTILEIGCFLGGSTLRWLNACPDVQIVAVDPWPDGDAGDFASSEQWWFQWPKPSEDIVRALNGKDGLYNTFLANVADHKNRVVAIRGESEYLLDGLAEMGLDPGIIYIDADKKRSDLDACLRLWPNAWLTGDDYQWEHEGGYPMQEHVNAFAAEHGFTVLHWLQTWVIVPPTRSW